MAILLHIDKTSVALEEFMKGRKLPGRMIGDQLLEAQIRIKPFAEFHWTKKEFAEGTSFVEALAFQTDFSIWIEEFQTFSLILYALWRN